MNWNASSKNNYSIGKGKIMSIWKAAIIFYYENKDPDESLNYGNIQDMHDIVDIAWADHQGPFTPAQVSSRLNASSLWDNDPVRGFYAWMRGSWKATLYRPSAKGKAFYDKWHLDNFRGTEK